MHDKLKRVKMELDTGFDGIEKEKFIIGLGEKILSALSECPGSIQGTAHPGHKKDWDMAEGRVLFEEAAELEPVESIAQEDLQDDTMRRVEQDRELCLVAISSGDDFKTLN
jgi:hypothetical protein